jgi:hypothetical protein
VRGGLWLIRLLLLVAVSAVVFSPLVVHGEASTPRPLDLDYDVSALTLPCSPAYPAVAAYREVRLALSDGRCEKARASLSFANDDAAAIMELVNRQRYSEAVLHAATFTDDFDRSVGWTVIAGLNGTNVASLLAQLKNDHLGQQMVLAQACAMLPPWAVDGLETAMQHTAGVLLDAIVMLETGDQAAAYRASIELVQPGIAPEPRVVVTEEPAAETPEETAVFDSEVSISDEEPQAQTVSVDGPDIVSMSVRPSPVNPGETCRISCNVAYDSTEPLQYTWSCRRGDLDAGGSHADWLAPDSEGTYEVSVTVTDSVEVRVRESKDDGDDASSGDVSDPMSAAPDASASPEIHSVSVTADHKYLEHASVGYAILVSRSCTLVVEVDDPDAVTFAWGCNGGSLSDQEGNSAVWSAPHAVGNFKVTVVVTNADGDQDSEVINFHCTTCSQCF